MTRCRLMTRAIAILKHLPRAELLWASPREVLNVVQAEACGCHIITATPDLIAKMPLFGKDLRQYSLETVKMFHEMPVQLDTRSSDRTGPRPRAKRR